MALPMPFSNPSTYAGHSGCDFAQPLGTPILASGPGRVVRLSHSSAGGYWTVVVYDAYPGVEIGYAHQPAERHAPAAGKRFAKGDRIGTVGSTGHSTGPHVHLEVIGQGTYAAVWKYFTKGAYVGGAATTSLQKSADVVKQQTWLNRARKAGLTVDGLRGPKTIAAFKAYQKFLAKSYGYKGAIDGVWGKGTQAAHQKYYNKVNAKKPATSSKTGDATIRKVQQKLKTNYPLYAGKLVVDGINGPKTIAAVKEFQRRSGLTVDGIAGPKTRKALGL